MKNRLILGLGSNEGDRCVFLTSAILSIREKIGDIVCQSSFYESEAWGGVAKGKFVNAVVEVETMKMPSDILKVIQEIERDAGRIRKEKWGDRTLDIDILFYSNWIVNSERLTIPHPFLQKRRFVLLPLYEIMPDFEHPFLRKKVKDLLDICSDNQIVIKYTLDE